MCCKPGNFGTRPSYDGISQLLESAQVRFPGRKKMKNLKFSRLFAAALLVACFAFAGCKPQNDDIVLPENVRVLTNEDGIIGKWADNYEAWNTYDTYDCQIKTNLAETASYDAHTSTVYIKKTSETSGYLYYQFSKPIYLFGVGTVDVTGKWGAMAFQNLTENSVQMCDADYSDNEFVSTIDDCVTKYTKEAGKFNYITTPFTRVSD